MRVNRTNPRTAIQGVYLIHFDSKYGHVRHYAGYGKDVHRRIQAQLDGKRTAANLIRVVLKAGIKIRLARVWLHHDRSYERRLKNSHKMSDYCPICREEKRRAKGLPAVGKEVEVNFYQ